jgi:hypothetical protein
MRRTDPRTGRCTGSVRSGRTGWPAVVRAAARGRRSGAGGRSGPGPVHVITTLPPATGWTVRVSDGPVPVCAYPPLPLWPAWLLCRAARRCWPRWQVRLTRAGDSDTAGGWGRG